eukprot:2154696-Amphidinium_carterae.1
MSKKRGQQVVPTASGKAWRLVAVCRGIRALQVWVGFGPELQTKHDRRSSPASRCAALQARKDFVPSWSHGCGSSPACRCAAFHGSTVVLSAWQASDRAGERRRPLGHALVRAADALVSMVAQGIGDT